MGKVELSERGAGEAGDGKADDAKEGSGLGEFEARGLGGKGGDAVEEGAKKLDFSFEGGNGVGRIGRGRDLAGVVTVLEGVDVAGGRATTAGGCGFVRRG